MRRCCRGPEVFSASTAVRAGVGAIEGTAGMAMVEPFVYAATQQEQADYTLNNAFMDVAFGSIFGGGLHVASGSVGEILARMHSNTGKPDLGQIGQMIQDAPFKVREDAMRAAVAQAVDGRKIDVTPIWDTQGGIQGRFGTETRIGTNEFQPQGRIEVWHGSPHDFAQFDAGKIGTGEGAQAYGHGYFAAERTVTANHLSHRPIGHRNRVRTNIASYGVPMQHRLAGVDWNSDMSRWNQHCGGNERLPEAIKSQGTAFGRN